MDSSTQGFREASFRACLITTMGSGLSAVMLALMLPRKSSQFTTVQICPRRRVDLRAMPSLIVWLSLPQQSASEDECIG